MRWWEWVPNSLLAVGVIGGFVGLSLLGFRLAHPWIQRFSLTHNELARFVFEGISVIYAVLLGLVAVGAWENYTAAERAIAHEAATLTELALDLEAYPPAVRQRLEAMLVDYASLVVSDDWPRLARREEPHASGRAIEGLVREWARFEPVGTGQGLMHAEALRNLDDLIGYRRQRILAGTAGLPGELWFVLFAGATLTVGFTYCFWTDNRRVHAAMITSLAGMLGLVVFLIIALDHPLWGRAGLGPEPFDRARTLLREHVGTQVQ